MEALEALVEMANGIDFTSHSDMMLISPIGLHTSCSASLFDDEALLRLNDLVLLQQKLSLSNGELSDDVPEDEISTKSNNDTNHTMAAQSLLQVPPELLTRFGGIFVEIIYLMMAPK